MKLSLPPNDYFKFAAADSDVADVLDKNEPKSVIATAPPELSPPPMGFTSVNSRDSYLKTCWRTFASLKSRAEYFLIGVRGSMIQDSDSHIDSLGLPAKPQRPIDTFYVMRESKLLPPELLDNAELLCFLSSKNELPIPL